MHTAHEPVSQCGYCCGALGEAASDDARVSPAQLAGVWRARREAACEECASMEKAEALGDDFDGAAVCCGGVSLRCESKERCGARDHPECRHAGESALFESKLCCGFRWLASPGYRRDV